MMVTKQQSPALHLPARGERMDTHSQGQSDWKCDSQGGLLYDWKNGEPEWLHSFEPCSSVPNNGDHHRGLTLDHTPQSGPNSASSASQCLFLVLHSPECHIEPGDKISITGFEIYAKYSASTTKNMVYWESYMTVTLRNRKEFLCCMSWSN